MHDNTFRIEIQDANIKLAGHDILHTTNEGEYIVCKWQSSETLCHIKVLSATQYIVLETGEIKTFVVKDSKDVRVLQRAMAHLRGIIRRNFSGGDRQIMLTLTYKSNMQDQCKLYRDWCVYSKWIRRQYVPDLEYVAIAEPQGRGAWHLHILCKSLFKLWLPQVAALAKWRQVTDDKGSVYIERLKPSSDVGAYYVAYFTDTIDPAIDTYSATSIELSKARKKGARLHLYPRNFRFYRCSKGIIRPETDKFTVDDLTAIMGDPIYTTNREVVKVYDDNIRKPITAIHTAVYRSPGRHDAYARLCDGRARRAAMIADYKAQRDAVDEDTARDDLIGHTPTNGSDAMPDAWRKTWIADTPHCQLSIDT